MVLLKPSFYILILKSASLTVLMGFSKMEKSLGVPSMIMSS